MNLPKILPFLLVLILTPIPVQASPICCNPERSPTLVDDYFQADMVLLGKFSNPKLGKAIEDSTTDFTIDEVLKPHEILGKNKTITLPRYIPDQKYRYLIYCDVLKGGGLDPYRGVPIEKPAELSAYLQGAVKLKGRPADERLTYAFKFLNSPEIEVHLDAYREFAKSDYKDYMEVARTFDANQIAGWLGDPKTPAYRYGLYALLLGHCGKTEHAPLLRNMIDDPKKRLGANIEGLLLGYLMLEPEKGWVHLQAIIKKEEFLVRYSALRSLRFLWEQKPDLVEKKELLKGLSLILDHADMADFAVEDLRKWKQWQLTDRVLDLFDRPSHKTIPVVKRSILRFALQSPHARAAAFVKEQRKRDATWVSDTEELLKLEP